MTDGREDAPVGAVKRSALVLRALANGGKNGVPLSTLSQVLGLPHATTHRLLRGLVDEGLARQVHDTKRYALGHLSYELGLAAGQQFDMRATCGTALAALWNATREAVYLVVRSGDEAVCVDCREGTGVLRVHPLAVGSRRPLGVGAGGLAIITAITAPERETVIRRILPVLASRWDTAEPLLRRQISSTNRRGHALVRNRVTPGVSAVGMPVHGSEGQVVAALSVATPTAQMTERRLASYTEVLTEQVVAAEAAIRNEWNNIYSGSVESHVRRP